MDGMILRLPAVHIASSGPLSLCSLVGQKGDCMDEGEVGAAPLALSAVRAGDLERRGVLFVHGPDLFLTTGEHVGKGGMGNAFLLSLPSTASSGGAEIDRGPRQAVGKVFHAEYLYQLRTDEITRRDHSSVLAHMHLIAKLTHPNVLPTLISAPIADNHLTVTPREYCTLLHAI